MASIIENQETSVANASNAGHTSIDLNVGTRKSKLALVQTDMVIDALKEVYPQHRYHVKASNAAVGDIDKVTPFKDMAVKNIWTHELETLMIEGELQLLVHALKDCPTQLPPDCEIGGVLIREDPRDVLVVKAGRPERSITDLAPGSVLGTSSIRRTAQLAFKYPHLKVQDCRGNVPTRLSKLDAEDGPFDALCISAAGLIRLGLGDRITQYLDSTNGGMLYAVSQGAIGIENKFSNSQIRDMIKRINHTKTYLEVTAERSLLRTIEGGCSAPLGVETSWSQEDGGKHMRMQAIVVSVNGQESAAADLTQQVEDVASAESFGKQLAKELLSQGADKILAEIKAKKPTTAADLQET